MAENESLKVCLERRNFTGIAQKFHKNQFIFTGKTQEQEKKFPCSKQSLSVGARAELVHTATRGGLACMAELAGARAEPA
jgi:hypothetical protein